MLHYLCHYSAIDVLQSRHATVSHIVHAPSSSPPVIMSSDIVALPATDANALKQLLNTLVTFTTSSSVLMPSDIVTLPTTDAEVPKQRLDTLVTAAEAAEEKAAAARCRILATRQLLDKEQVAVTDLEQQAASKKLVPRSTSSSTTETVTTSPSYVNNIIANFHIQADTIHMDTSGPAAAPTVFYSNKTMPAPLSCALGAASPAW
jgi:hypothetical protein